ncbi:MAG TPA: glycosyltransferase family 61 protein [Puia sp.]|nr:glycosyltransferase family 61 protein [Puia sp.]
MIGVSKEQVVKSKEFKRKLPVNLSIENINHFNVNLKYRCPDLFIFYFKSVYFLPDNTLFLYKIWPLGISFPYYKKRLRHHSIKGLFDIQRSWRNLILGKALKPYVTIHDPWTSNYYHWMTQALPRLLMVLKKGISFTLLLPETHCTEFHNKSLEVLGIENWTTFEVDKIYFKVFNLVYPAHDIQIGDYNDDLMIELSLALKKGLRTKKERNYLFVHRVSKNVRRIVNEEEVLSTFLSWGFKIVNFETLSFDEQRIIAGEASIMAGVHGAGLTNMFFMEKGSKVLELMSLLNGEQYYYFTLSNALGHDYYYQECKPEVGGKSIQETNLIVNIEQLNRNIELMVKQDNG